MNLRYQSGSAQIRSVHSTGSEAAQIRTSSSAANDTGVFCETTSTPELYRLIEISIRLVADLHEARSCRLAFASFS